MGFCNCSMFCLCVTLCCNHLDGEERAGCLLCLSSWCLMIVVWLFLTIPRVYLQFVIVVYPDHNHYFLSQNVRLSACTVKKAQARLFKLADLSEPPPPAYIHLPRSPLSQNIRLSSCTVKKAQARLFKYADLSEPSLLT